MLTILGTCLLLASYLPITVSQEAACDMKFSVPIEGEIDDDLTFIATDGTMYRAGQYWHDNSRYWGCICKVKKCVQKCCPDGFVADNLDCVPDNTTSVRQQLPEYKVYREDSDGNLELVKDVPRDYFHVIVSTDQNFTCDAFVPYAYEIEGSALLEDGQIKFPLPDDVPNGINHFKMESFCMEVNATTGTMHYYGCFGPEPPPKEALKVYPYFLVVNIFFLVITLIVYILLPPLRNNPAKCMMNLLVALIIGDSLLASQQFTSTHEPRYLCRIIAYTMYFFLLAGFFWLNVMCYDIYSAFRKMKSMPRSQSKKRYVMIGHSCYAWGCPLVMTVFAYFVDMIGPSWLIRPRLAVSSCWFGETASLYLYFYGPMMLLLAANIYFFAITIYKLYEVSKQTAVLKNSESNSNHEKERDRCYLYGKLFVVMGVSWVMEVVSERLGGSEYLWYLTDIFNICQGIGIFIIFVLKRRVLYMLNKKFLPSHMFISECETTKATSSSTATTSNNGNALNGAALNGNGRKQEAADNMYVEKGYDNPIPMTPISTRVDAQNGGTTNGDVSVPIDDTTVIQRY
ncbi:G-protein coupled receptor Mth2 isoform X2 [Nilaparvata lugens]|uniref:G-protein coupled receptor Mth2 isoform X2 n=1 Tax=Nilaparvata lugens TaxID=108931 RepID=UPI00193EA2AC|nr:G-protein coupled receptor Mth2 isoform X2 [Nilaparvata lugens]